MEKQNRNILIIGGSRGIGAEAVRQFSAAGDKVVFTYHRSELEADDLRQKTGAVPVRCDVKFSNSVRIAVDKAMSVTDNRIDVLICNASITDDSLLADIEETRWEEVIDTNLNGTFYSIKYVLPQMLRRKSGCIITVSSKWGPVGATGKTAWAASKAGVIGLSKALAGEAGSSGIRVYCVVTDGAGTNSDEDPSEVVKVMQLLASEDCPFMNGQTVGGNGDAVK